jgi:putative transposase
MPSGSALTIKQERVMQKMIPALTDRQRFWLEHIQACEASGKSMAKYAASQDIAVRAMYAGKKILVKKGLLSGMHPHHPVYPYLLRGLTIDRPNQVWAMDLTYIPMARGFVYLVAVLDWYSRKVLSWRVSITMDVHFCLEAAEEAIARYGAPEIMNTDQGSQFTSLAFTGLMKDHGIRISMDGKGAWRDNVFIERLWRSVKYEEVYLHAYDTVCDSRNGMGRYFDLYNQRRPHSALGRKTPDSVYFSQQSLTLAA